MKEGPLIFGIFENTRVFLQWTDGRTDTSASVLQVMSRRGNLHNEVIVTVETCEEIII